MIDVYHIYSFISWALVYRMYPSVFYGNTLSGKGVLSMIKEGVRLYWFYVKIHDDKFNFSCIFIISRLWQQGL